MLWEAAQRVCWIVWAVFRHAFCMYCIHVCIFATFRVYLDPVYLLYFVYLHIFQYIRVHIFVYLQHSAIVVHICHIWYIQVYLLYSTLPWANHPLIATRFRDQKSAKLLTDTLFHYTHTHLRKHQVCRLPFWSRNQDISQMLPAKWPLLMCLG